MQSILFLDYVEASLYSGRSGVDSEVIAAFPSARDDLAEAAKCLALGRATAVVFHCMRVLEIALRAVAQTLNDQSIDPARNPTWGSILRKFDGELAKPLSERAVEWKADDAFYAGVAARLHAIKDAWRNPTMHPAAIYTEEQATDIWHETQGFMRHLAGRITEAGYQKRSVR